MSTPIFKSAALDAIWSEADRIIAELRAGRPKRVVRAETEDEKLERRRLLDRESEAREAAENDRWMRGWE